MRETIPQQNQQLVSCEFCFLLLFFFFLLCHPACGSWFPDQGWNSCSLQWKQGPNHWTARELPLKVRFFYFLFYLFIFGDTSRLVGS